MHAFPFKTAAFVKSAVAEKGYPQLRDPSGHLLPEIAVVGRSNVGKSTLLNHLFRQKKLVKTSSTPGKTQEINFFLSDEKLSVVDLPGYGYAQVPDRVKKNWGPMMREYLHNRGTLKLIVWLLDIRRLPNVEDLQFLEWLLNTEKAVILVLTKVDKVNRGERQRSAKAILASLGCENLHHTFYSAPKNEGRHELIRMINDALEDELQAAG